MSDNLTKSEIDWSKVRRVLVVRLRSIGDTVLATSSLIALKRFLPEAQIDILLEDWVAPLLDGFDSVDNVLSVGKASAERMKMAWQIRRNKYDVVFNLHGGTTGTFFTFASGARHRVGGREYQYKFLYNQLLFSAADFWQQTATHSAEQQLALLGFVGVPVEDRPRSRLAITDLALNSVNKRLEQSTIRNPQSGFALFHPVAAFATKIWAVENFARTAEFLSEKGIQTVAIAARNETAILERLVAESNVPVTTFNGLSLQEITAVAAHAELFVGNDSGIAHIAAAVNTPSVVIFGSSNRDHWRPWTDAPNEIVYEEFPCQPCPGYVCSEFGEPKCILSVRSESVFDAIDNILRVK
ncbi:MAG: glycosyltransferase family 9 protein [Pyrinomonadaceae bacterium]